MYTHIHTYINPRSTTGYTKIIFVNKRGLRKNILRYCLLRISSLQFSSLWFPSSIWKTIRTQLTMDWLFQIYKNHSWMKTGANQWIKPAKIYLIIGLICIHIQNCGQFCRKQPFWFLWQPSIMQDINVCSIRNRTNSIVSVIAWLKIPDDTEVST